MIKLVKPSDDNLIACIKLYDTLDDIQKLQVAPNSVSLAEAYIHYEDAWPRVIMDDDTVVGFIMLELNSYEVLQDDKPGHYIWRFMIGKAYQNKGIGKQVLQLIKSECLKQGMKSLYVSVVKNFPMPYQFYIRNGFIDCGYEKDSERYLKLLL